MVKYVKHDKSIFEMMSDMKIVPEEIQKICITHIHFCCTHAHAGNTLAKKDENGIHRLTVIDTEECFTNFNLRVVWWVNNKAADENFSTEMVRYVRDLNVDGYIGFLKRCEWEPPTALINQFKTFTQFLKFAVDCQLKPKDIGLLATGIYKKHRKLNFQDIVDASNRRSGDEEFVKSAYKKMKESLEEYASKVYPRHAIRRPNK